MRYSAIIQTTHVTSRQLVRIKLKTNSFEQLARILSIYNLSINQLELVRFSSLYYYNELFSICVARQTTVNGPELKFCPKII